MLRPILLAHRLATGGRGLVFGAAPERPFTQSAIRRRAANAWKAADKVSAEKTPDVPVIGRIVPHEARHSLASLCIAAGVNAKAICTYMGHSSITVTFDRYGHLMPGNEDEACELVTNYLARTVTVSS